MVMVFATNVPGLALRIDVFDREICQSPIIAVQPVHHDVSVRLMHLYGMRQHLVSGPYPTTSVWISLMSYLLDFQTAKHLYTWLL